MLRLINHSTSPLLLQLRQSIVIRYTPKRSTFDKTTYNQDYIPRQTPFHKSRKPRQAQWQDPNVVFPRLIPPMYKPVSFKHYVKRVIQAQERQKAMRSKQYILGDIRSGDIVDITYQQTFENDQTVTHRCYVLSFKRKNSVSAAMQVAIRFGGMSLKCIYLVHSPRIKKIQLVSRGSGCFRSNLKHNWQKMNKTQLVSPRIKKRVMKARNVTGARKKQSARKRIGGVKFDQITTDNVKRLV